MPVLLNRRALYTFFSALIILIGTAIAIRYAKGGFHVTDDGFQSETGLLAANSFPSGAQVFINGNLVTATDDTLYLEPGEYDVRIVKDGYSPWQKLLKLEKELVVQTNSTLFPIAPSLTNLTFTGLENIAPSPDGQKILYYTASNSAQKKNGLYVLDLVDNPLPIQKGPRQVAEDAPSFNLATAKFIWSPDSSKVMILSDNRQVVIDTDRNNDLAELPDSTFQRKQILSEWEQEMYLRERQFLSQFPDEVIDIATNSAKNVYISPDKKRLLYTAIAAVTLPDTIVPPVPATNTQPEERTLQPNGVYVYDREEDRNFRVGTEASSAAQPVKHEKHLLAYEVGQEPALATAAASLFRSLQATQSAQTASNFNTYYTSLYANTFQWFPDSRHLLTITGNHVEVMEYDSTNKTTLYSGPFDQRFLYPWPDGSRALIITSFSPDSPRNLYAIELK